MKRRSILFGILCMLALSFSFVACDDDDDDLIDDGSSVTLPSERAYVLNQGGWGSNNASITFYAPNGDADVISDIYKTQNSASLGDLGQDIIEYNDYIYVSVNGSNYLAKLNSACVEVDRVSFASGDSDLSGGIRSIDAEDGYIYASFYGGVVAKINANTLEVTAKLTGIGDNLEGVVIEDNKLYVCNSYSVDANYNYTYHTEVYVINLKTFTLADTITVAQNPNILVEEDDKIFLISMDYSSANGYVLQMIDPKNNNAVTQIGYASYMAADNDMLYYVNSVTDWTTYETVNTFSSYNIKTGATTSNILSSSSATTTLSSAGIYMIEAEDRSLYIGTTSWGAGTDTVYRFTTNGTYVDSFDCGYYPWAMAFID